MNTDILFDASQPFTGEKLKVLEFVVAMSQSGDTAKMSEAGEVLNNLQKSTNFWLQTDTIIQHSEDTRTIFYSLAALDAGVKVS